MYISLSIYIYIYICIYIYILTPINPHGHQLEQHKICLRQQEMPPTIRDASDYKRCLRLQEMPLSKNNASYYELNFELTRWSR